MADVLDLTLLVGQLVPWKSRIMGKVGAANIKLIRMTEMGSPVEVHDYDEAVYVIDGLLALEMADELSQLEIRTGELFMIPARHPHRIAEGSHGTLLLVDLQDN
jgi:mannose-6-phosphate isomerase-like protein (cupin superfamily)